MADYYYYRRKVENQKRRRRAVVALLAVVVLLCAAAGYLYFRSDQAPEEPVAAPAATPSPAPESSPATAEHAAASAETATAENAAPFTPQRLLPVIEASAWDHSDAVEQTIDFEYTGTDARMVGLPALGRVSREHFNTVTFLGDSITEGLAIYDTGLPNAHVRGYRSTGPQIIVNNTVVRDEVRGVEEAALDAVVATQPDFLYVLFGTNTLTVQGNEESFLAYYEQMIRILQEKLPGVPIYMQSIPGVQETVVEQTPGLDNARIQTVNNMLANLALRTGCYFLNIQEALCTPAGDQIDAYSAADGIHFNPTGYGVWVEYLSTHTAWDRRNKYEGADPWYILGS